LASRRSLHRSYLRSDDPVERSAFRRRLSGPPAENPVQGHENGENPRLFDEQLRASGAHDRGAVSVPLADRGLLQVDQTASSNQILLRHFRERREDPDLDRDLRIPLGRDPEEATRTRTESLHNSTDPERHALRESPRRTSSFDD